MGKFTASTIAAASILTATALSNPALAADGPTRIGEGVSGYQYSGVSDGKLSDDANTVSWNNDYEDDEQSVESTDSDVLDRATGKTKTFNETTTAHSDLSANGTTLAVDGTLVDNEPHASIRDIASGKRTYAPEPSGSGHASWATTISDSGKWVALMATDPATSRDNVYRWNIADNSLKKVTSATNSVSSPQISGDGRKIAYAQSGHTYLRTVSTGDTVQLDRSTSGSVGNGKTWPVEVNRTGSYVLLMSTSTNLAPNSGVCAPPQGEYNTGCLFRRNVAGKTTTGASILPTGALTRASAGSLSSDGRVVGFTGTDKQTYARRLSTSTTKLVSKDASGAKANAETGVGDVNGDGSKIVFNSSATNLDGKDCPTGCMWFAPTGL